MRSPSLHSIAISVSVITLLSTNTLCIGREKEENNFMPRVRVSSDGNSFVVGESDQPFIPWGFNYVGRHGHLAEDNWTTTEGWQRIEKDFAAMQALNVNVVRWHMQLPTFMKTATQPNKISLAQLRKLLVLARKYHLYLDLTGLNCFRLTDLPPWYNDQTEQERWKTQAIFWDAIANTCQSNTIVFCYDLMNEPVIGKPKKDGHKWLGGELGGFHFVQRISLRGDGRKATDIAADWVDTLVQSIRRHDQETLTTVGVIPWSFVWPNAKPVFYSQKTRNRLDFVSIHVYPTSGRLEKDVQALAAYRLGQPVVLEELFPINCSVEELDQFIDTSQENIDGWIAHYFGYSAKEHRAGASPGPLVAGFFDYWQTKRSKVEQNLSRQTIKILNDTEYKK